MSCVESHVAVQVLGEAAERGDRLAAQIEPRIA
jgi:hypothetical protein